VFTVVNAFVRGRAALIATRLMVGAFEAGFYPTASAYLSYFYRRYDLAVRLALFYGQFAIAGAFSGSIGMSARVFKSASATLTNIESIWSVSSQRDKITQLAVSVHH
jgi:MFS family permease